MFVYFSNLSSIILHISEYITHPINYLRNIAMENVVTGFVFLSDIDFLPGLDTYTSLKKSVHAFYDVGIPGNSITPKLIGERYF